MTPDAFRAELARLGLTQAEAARFFNVEERRPRRWATGEATIPRSVKMVFALMRRFDLSPRDVRDILKQQRAADR